MSGLVSVKWPSHIYWDRYVLLLWPNSQSVFTDGDSEAKRSGWEPGSPGIPDVHQVSPGSEPALVGGAFGPGEL